MDAHIFTLFVLHSKRFVSFFFQQQPL